MRNSPVATLTLLMATALVPSIPVAAAAQTPTAPLAQPAVAPTSPAQPTQLSADQFAQSAIAVAQGLDGTQAPGIYGGASTVMKRAVAQDVFLQNLRTQRQAVGAVRDRQWISVERLFVEQKPDGKIPGGEYISVRVAARTAANGVVLELVTFRFDEDRTWRLSGFQIQSPPKPTG